MSMNGQAQPSDFVVTFSYETWHDAVQREMMRPPDRLVTTLMNSAEVDRLLVANPFRSIVSVAVRSVIKDGDSPFPTSTTRSLHQPIRLKRRDSTDLARIVKEMRGYDESLRRAAHRRGLRSPVVVTTNPLVAAFAPLGWAEYVTYYGRDDWLGFDNRRRYWPAFDAAYRQIANAGTAVVAVSQQIIDRIEPSGAAVVVPNGVEPDEWIGPHPQPPEWMATLPSPRAVYVGTLDSRLDVEGLARFSKERPDVTTILVGPYQDRAHLAPLDGLSNVHIRRPVGRAELVAILRNADLCLVAHVRSRLTEAMSPLKIFEYLAAGAPVLSIDLPPVRGLGERVRLVDSVGDFVSVVDECLALGRAPESEREAFVHANSWAERHRVIMDTARRRLPVLPR